MISLKQTLLTTAAITILATSPVLAEEQETQQGWWGNMVESVQAWYAGDNAATEGNQDVESFLDEVTIAVPPMTEEDAANIEPAAGDEYQNTVDEVLEENMNNNSEEEVIDQQSYNTDFTNSEGSIAAFDNPDGYMTIEDMASIVPAAGDAEEITEESIVVTSVEEAADEAGDATEEMADAAEDTAEDVQSDMNDAADAVEDEMVDDQSMVEEMMDNAEGAASAVAKGTKDLANEAVEGTKSGLKAADETIKDGIKSMSDMVSGEESHDHEHDHE